MENNAADASPPSQQSKPPKKQRKLPEPPEELAAIWDEQIACAFLSLTPKQQKFITVYIREQNSAEAYRQAYNPEATTKNASSCGAHFLSTPSVRPILERFADRSLEALFVVPKTFFEATSAVKPAIGRDEAGQPILVDGAPDHDVRIKGAVGLAKLYGLNAPEKLEIKPNQNVPAEFTSQFNFYLQQMGKKPVALPAVEEAEYSEVGSEGYAGSFQRFAAQ